MSWYTLHVASLTTGNESQIRLEAETEDEARKLASDYGWAVQSIGVEPERPRGRQPLNAKEVEGAVISAMVKVFVAWTFLAFALGVLYYGCQHKAMH